MSNTERKMAAILAMDVVSYSEKMGRAEEGTLRHLRACREIIENVVTENRGRIFNTAGDAFMIEFSSAVSAISAAVDIQKLIKSRNDSLPPEEQMMFRIGVNVGDIIIEGNNLYGEGVNIAARLESIALPGMSAHADASQIIDWLRTLKKPPRHVYVTHGEPTAADALRCRIERELRWHASVPMLGDSVTVPNL